MIHVCLCFHDKTGHYAKFAGTTMLSLLENTDSEVTVHILHDNTLTPDNHDKFIYLAGRYNQQVRFYNVEKLCADKLSEYVNMIPAIKSDLRVGKGAFFRLLIPKILPLELDKVIYLGSDIIVNLDINTLWQTEIDNHPLGVVPECFQTKDKAAFIAESMQSPKIYKDGFIKAEDYFNSGVLLMNLKILRNAEDKILLGLKFRNEHPEYNLFDQEVLNYAFASRALKLPVNFNRFVISARSDNESISKGKIYHYAGNSEGLHLDMNDPFNRLWMDHFIKTPWFDSSVFGKVYDYVLKLSNDHLEQMKKLSASLSNKTRAFVVTAEQLERVKNDFFIRDDKEIIIAEKDVMYQELIDKIKAERDKKIFFGFVAGFPEVLANEGLIENEDFFNGFLFYPRAYAYFVLKDGYQIIKEM